jgi:HSP20 family protein
MLTRLSDVHRMFNTLNYLRSSIAGLSNEMDRSWKIASPGLEGTPRTNLSDNGDRFELSAEVPGLGKDDISIKIQGNYLELSGQRKTDRPEAYTVHRVERRSSSFRRSFTLPADVDADKVEASLNNGILNLVLPKAEAAKPKQISIK